MTLTNPNNRITQLSFEALQAAINRSRNKHPAISWNPIYADVVDLGGIKRGHVASDGYGHKLWSYYPLKEHRAHRRTIHDVPFERVVPKYVGRFSLTAIESLEEKHQK